MNEKQLLEVHEIIKRTKAGKIKLFKSMEDMEILVNYIEHLEARCINPELSSETLRIKVLQKQDGEGVPDSPIYTVTEDGFKFNLEENKKFRFIQANEKEILVETEPLSKRPIEEAGKGFKVRK